MIGKTANVQSILLNGGDIVTLSREKEVIYHIAFGGVKELDEVYAM